MGILRKFLGNPIDNKAQETLATEMVHLERRERLLSSEIEGLEARKRDLFNKGFSKSPGEQLTLARELSSLDHELTKKRVQFERLTNSIRVIGQLITIYNYRQILVDAGLLDWLRALPKTKLESFLERVNLAKTLRETPVTELRSVVKTEFGILGDSYDGDVRKLLEIWSAERTLDSQHAFNWWKDQPLAVRQVSGNDVENGPQLVVASADQLSRLVGLTTLGGDAAADSASHDC